MNFEAAINRINKDFCNLFFAKYMKGLWGIVVGYRTVPDYLARMRKQLADWQEANDCSNELCAESNFQLQPSGCPPGYTFIKTAAYPNGVCMYGTNGNICNACPVVPPTVAVITVLSYGTFAAPGTCVLNPPLEPFGPGCFDRHWWPGNVNSMLMSSFTR